MAKLRNQFTWSLRPGITLLPIVVPVGKIGAVGSYEVGHGLKSVVRAGVGLYTVNFDEKYLGLTNFQFSMVDLTTADGYTGAVVDSRSIDGRNTTLNGGDGYLQVQVTDDASSAKDPVSCKLSMLFIMKTSEQG